MGFIAVKCTNCGSNIEVDENKEKGFCPHCGTTFVAINRNSSFNSLKNIAKNSLDREQRSAENYILSGESFIKLDDYLSAKQMFLKASEAEPLNYKVWAALLWVESKITQGFSSELYLDYAEKLQKTASDKEIAEAKELYGIKTLYDLRLEKEQEQKRLQEEEKRREEERRLEAAALWNKHIKIIELIAALPIFIIIVMLVLIFIE